VLFDRRPKIRGKIFMIGERNFNYSLKVLKLVKA